MMIVAMILMRAFYEREGLIVKQCNMNLFPRLRRSDDLDEVLKIKTGPSHLFFAPDFGIHIWWLIQLLSEAYYLLQGDVHFSGFNLLQIAFADFELLRKLIQT